MCVYQVPTYHTMRSCTARGGEVEPLNLMASPNDTQHISIGGALDPTTSHTHEATISSMRKDTTEPLGSNAESAGEMNDVGAFTK